MNAFDPESSETESLLRAARWPAPSAAHRERVLDAMGEAAGERRAIVAAHRPAGTPRATGPWPWVLPEAAAGAAAAASASPSTASSANTFFGSVVVNISGIPGASELEARLPEILASAFEAIGLSLGSAPPASPVASGA